MDQSGDSLSDFAWRVLTTSQNLRGDELEGFCKGVVNALQELALKDQ